MATQPGPMAFRMLRYVTRIWDQHLREHPGARQLPAVIPLVVHHGPAPWASPVQVLDLIDLSPAAAARAARPYLPRLEFLLDDLPRADGPQLRDRNLTPPALITLLLLKTAPGNPASELRDLAASPGPDAEEAYMTTAQTLRAEGEALGEARGERHAIRMVARARGLALTDEHCALIDGCDDLATLHQWSNAALTANRPDDIFE